MNKYIFLILILVLALFLRLYRLDQVPIELFGDELDVGFQAYSLLKTGQDLSGQFLPTLIHSLAEYRAPLFIYSTVPFVAAFGLNEWGVRLPAVFWGLLSLIFLYFLANKILSKKIALIAAFLLAISPWHIHYSRASFEVTMLLSILLLATFLFLKTKEDIKYLIGAVFLFGLTPYIYSTAVIFMPVLLLSLFLINKDLANKRNIFISLLILIAILTPYGINSLTGKAGERFNVISIFSEKSLQAKVSLAQQSENLPFNLQRFFHNKPLIFAQTFTINYLRAFSPEFLFLSGDPNSRHAIHEMGELYLFELPLLLLGGWLLIRKGNKEKKIIFSWLLLAPIPASLTYDGGFHATRNFLMLPPLVLISALGMNYILEDKRTFIKISLLFFIALSFILFFHRYFIHYPAYSARAWHYGFKEAMLYVKDNQIHFSRVYINNTYEPALIRFLFWTSYDPVKFHKEFVGDRQKNNIIEGFNGFNLENRYFFGQFNRPFENQIKPTDLFIASARDDVTNPQILENGNIKLLKTVYSPTKEVIFYILTGKNE